MALQFVQPQVVGIVKYARPLFANLAVHKVCEVISLFEGEEESHTLLSL